MKEIVKRYFRSWIEKEPSVIREYFSDNVYYSECYGPEYLNRGQCLRWFEDWNRKGSVLEWSIGEIREIGGLCVVEWYFKCEYEGAVDGFDGVSLISFEDGKITRVREFQSRAEHYRPYGDLP